MMAPAVRIGVAVRIGAGWWHTAVVSTCGADPPAQKCRMTPPTVEPSEEGGRVYSYSTVSVSVSWA